MLGGFEDIRLRIAASANSIMSCQSSDSSAADLFELVASKAKSAENSWQSCAAGPSRDPASWPATTSFRTGPKNQREAMPPQLSASAEFESFIGPRRADGFRRSYQGTSPSFEATPHSSDLSPSYNPETLESVPSASAATNSLSRFSSVLPSPEEAADIACMPVAKRSQGDRPGPDADAPQTVRAHPLTMEASLDTAWDFERLFGQKAVRPPAADDLERPTDGPTAAAGDSGPDDQLDSRRLAVTAARRVDMVASHILVHQHRNAS